MNDKKREEFLNARCMEMALKLLIEGLELNRIIDGPLVRRAKILLLENKVRREELENL